GGLNGAGADTRGADGAKVSLIDNGNDAAVGLAVAASGTTSIAGQYGTLLIDADGNYSYTRSTNTAGGGSESFTYTLKDGDGDTSTATLTIAIGDSGVTTTIPAANGATTTVQESALDGPPVGTSEAANPAANSDTHEMVSGTIDFTSPDGVGSITIAGTTLSGSY